MKNIQRHVICLFNKVSNIGKGEQKVWKFTFFLTVFTKTTVSQNDSFISTTALPHTLRDILLMSFSLSSPQRKCLWCAEERGADEKK